MFKPLFRLLALVSKELTLVARQPVMLLALVLGPFLILFIFGIGYRGQQPPLNAELVIPPGIELSRDPAYWRNRFGGSVRVVSVGEDDAAAIAALKSGQIDLAVIIPADAATSFADGRSATIRVLHDQISPTEETYITYAGYVLASELNKQLIAEVAARLQQDIRQTRASSPGLRQGLTQTRNDVQAGDIARARQHLAEVRAAIAAEVSALRTTEEFVARVAATTNGNSAVAGQLAALRQLTDQLNTLSTDLELVQAELSANPYAASSDLARIESQVGNLDALTAKVESIPPSVLASPFISQTQSVLPIQPGFVAFYSPAVLALLLQHLAITIAALSLVGERLLGTIELYQVAPTSTLGLLLGKYLSYAILGLGVGAALTVLMVYFLGVPLRGDPALFVGTVALLLFASLGIGLTISSFATSQEHAVQFSMLVLLASVFFSGFFLPLNTLQPPASYVSAVLPVTYTIVALQNLMFRGALVDPRPLIILGAIGTVLALLNVTLLNHQLRRK